MHRRFVWTSHRPESFDRDAYLHADTGGTHVWHGRHLDDPHVIVVGTTTAQRCVAVDDVDAGASRQRYGMPMAQTWVRMENAWQCVAGEAGDG